MASRPRPAVPTLRLRTCAAGFFSRSGFFANSISNSNTPPRIFKLTKPLTDQSVVINLGYEQKVQVDFSAIANEKITLVHIGEKLIVLFDNQSTVTVEPFFDSRHDALKNLTIEVAPGRDLTVAEFASTFPITTDASVLPAAGTGGNAQASGGNFLPPLVDELPPIPSNRLAPQEELGNLEFTNPTAFLPPEPPPPAPPAPPPPLSPLSIIAGIGRPLVVDESFIPQVGSQTVVPGTPNSNSDTQAFATSFTVDAPAGVQSITYALKVNDAITEMKKDGTMASIHKKWFGVDPEAGTSTVTPGSIPQAQ